MSSNNLVALIGLIAGFILGYLVTSNHYQDKLLDDVAVYKEQVNEARAKEREWQQLANKLDEEYKAKITDIQSNNDELITRLRQQLLSASRVPSNCESSSQSNGISRETRVSEEVSNIVEFSGQCAKRTDELIIQLESLQNWIKRFN